MMITRLCKQCNKEFQKELKAYIRKTNGKNGFVCPSCRREYQNRNARYNAHKKNRQTPMDKNINCSSHLGCYKAENFVYKYYGITDINPYGTHGYDCTCNDKYKIDVKSSTLYFRDNSSCWQFAIRKNIIPDYFILVAYNYVKDLNPVHMWEIPADLINNVQCLAISTNPITREIYNQFEKVLR